MNELIETNIEAPSAFYKGDYSDIYSKFLENKATIIGKETFDKTPSEKKLLESTYSDFLNKYEGHKSELERILYGIKNGWPSDDLVSYLRNEYKHNNDCCYNIACLLFELSTLIANHWDVNPDLKELESRN